ncbi:hypothetical protein [Marivita hallyeonensis]|uniref:Bile acid:Na+ symporter, BASS family n=1 Tax=Marivita hallyeonensis TaxID=996342 RepID=A0A1M5X3J9_9RHOB|nr:hypothetical protein [Marivita hallyeonensis]SHH94084.1 hypothetical protein SAMN05443551_3686 [Marivita hallyeonensis]
MFSALAWIGRHGKYFLIAGLFVGLLAPGLAETLRPWIGTLVAVLLFVTGVRVGARQAFGHLSELRPTLVRISVLQTLLPLVVIAMLAVLGVSHFPMAMAVSLMLAAPSLTGAPNFAIMMGHDPAPGMRLLVMGTAVFPVTALPVLLILDPAGGGIFSAFSLSLGLLAAILAAVSLGFTVRRFVPNLGDLRAQGALDGCAALLLAIVVVGLMSAIGPLLQDDPLALVLWLLAALAVNFVLVFVTLHVSRRAHLQMAVPTAIYAGNRNIALFLIVLPDEVAAPLMIFVGCYQVPMYLTPILLSRLAGEGPQDR